MIWILKMTENSLDFSAVIRAEKKKPYFRKIVKLYNADKNIYPARKDIFRALELTNFNDVKVVILGQDPYYNADLADGLAFSAKNCEKPPKSLKNIFLEIERDLGYNIHSTNLTKWAEQGVLLLNTSLTVEEGKPNSHRRMGWKTFIRGIIKALMERERPPYFLLWGNAAKKLYMSVAANQNASCMVCPHPSANTGFVGCGHFGLVNEWLKEDGLPTIDWKL